MRLGYILRPFPSPFPPSRARTKLSSSLVIQRKVVTRNRKDKAATTLPSAPGIPTRSHTRSHTLKQAHHGPTRPTCQLKAHQLPQHLSLGCWWSLAGVRRPRSPSAWPSASSGRFPAGARPGAVPSFLDVLRARGRGAGAAEHLSSSLIARHVRGPGAVRRRRFSPSCRSPSPAACFSIPRGSHSRLSPQGPSWRWIPTTGCPLWGQAGRGFPLQSG